MSILKAFFVHEIVRLHHSINRLENSVTGCSPTDPRHAGQFQMLENERHCRELLFTLAEQASGLGALKAELHIQYLLAKRVHDRSLANHRINGTGPTAEWWNTLGRMQYLMTLNEYLQKLLKQYTPEEVQAELTQAAAGKDVYAAALRSEVLGAMARAEGSAQEKSGLVRDDPTRSLLD